MNGQEIIEMARQTGDATKDARGRESFDFDSYGLEAFAKLVAAKEREACAKVCGDLMFGANPYERWEGMKWCMDRIKARGEA